MFKQIKSIKVSEMKFGRENQNKEVVEMKRLNGFSMFMSGVGELGSVMRNMLLILMLMVLGMIGHISQAHAQFIPGDILVIDLSAGTDDRGALFRVNPSNGNRTVISDFGSSSKGPLGVNPAGVAIDASGRILVIDASAGTNGRGALFRISPSSGYRTIIDDFGNPTEGELGRIPTDLAIESSGNILVIDPESGVNDSGTLFRFNPSTGIRVPLSHFGNPSKGPLGFEPFNVAVEASGDILVLDYEAGTDFRGALFRVNPLNGNRTIMSDFGDSSKGPLGDSPSELAIDASGNILVLDPSAGVLFRVNPLNGNRMVISSFDNSSQGPLGINPSGVAIGALGDILVTDAGNGTPDVGPLFKINPSNGNRTIISDFSNNAQGPLGSDPADIAVVVPKCNGIAATIFGTSGNNTINGTGGPDIIHGLSGNDTISGLGGNDTICGGNDVDTLNGGAGNDMLSGGEGNDTLRGNAGDDMLDGDSGADSCNGGGQVDGDAADECETVTNVP